MNKLGKKLLGLALAAAMAVSALSPMAVSAAGPSVQANQTVYQTAKSGSSSTQSIYVYDLTKSQTIKKSTVKSSDSKVAKLYALQKSTYSTSDKTEYYESGMKDSNYSYNDYSYLIRLRLLKAGKTTVSFKIGSKTYKTNLTVMGYTNPLSSVKITGINKGKSVASKLNKQNSANLTLKKTAKNAVISLKAKKGWKITDVSMTYYKDNGGYSYSNERYSYYSYGEGKSSVALRVGNLVGKGKYNVNISMKNTSNGGYLNCSYYINN